MRKQMKRGELFEVFELCEATSVFSQERGFSGNRTNSQIFEKAIY